MVGNFERAPSLALITMSVLLAGCFSPGETHTTSPTATPKEILPLKFTSMSIEESQFGGMGGQGTGNPYMGTIMFFACIDNLNLFEVEAQYGYEVYQVQSSDPTTDKTTLRLVKEKHGEMMGSRFGFDFLSSLHDVYLNEFVEGGTLNYAIHYWHQILNPGPILRQDRWYNFTIEPGGGHKFVEDGLDCGSPKQQSGNLWRFGDPYRNRTRVLEFTSIHVWEEPGTRGAAGELGAIRFAHCIENPNKFAVQARHGYEVYQLQPIGAVQLPPPLPILKLVQQSRPDPFLLPAGGIINELNATHTIFVNETGTGGTADYAIHLWQETPNPDQYPVLRQDRWYNLTFVPGQERRFVDEQESVRCGLAALPPILGRTA